MSRILLADDSPHAQRMGEFILREEGYEVVSLTDGETALMRLEDVDPDLILADVSLPGRNGYEICEYVKYHPKYRSVGVLLTAGAMEAVDEQEARRVLADGTLRKPFEASLVLAAVKPLIEAAQQARGAQPDGSAQPEESIPDEPAVPPPLAGTAPAPPAGAAPAPQASPAPDPPAGPTPAPQAGPAPDPQCVRAAVTIALEAALPVLIDEISQQVMLALAEETSAPLTATTEAEGASAG